MDPQTHFNSAVASALFSATIAQRELITALLNPKEPRRAEHILLDIGAIIGKRRLTEILMALEEVAMNERKSTPN